MHISSKIRAMNLSPHWAVMAKDEADIPISLRRLENNKLLHSSQMGNALRRANDLHVTAEELLAINKAIKDLKLEVFFMPEPEDPDSDDDSSDSTVWDHIEWPSTVTDDGDKLWIPDELWLMSFKDSELQQQS